MSATYFRHGEGRSFAARAAESESRHPLTRAVSELRKITGVSVKRAKEALLATHDGEWHHVGKFASRCNYYSVWAAEEWLAQEQRLGGDPLREEIEDAEWSEKCVKNKRADDLYRPIECFSLYYGGYDGWKREHAGCGTVGEAREFLYTHVKNSRGEWCGSLNLHEKLAERAREATSFRRWEAALRRLAKVSE